MLPLILFGAGAIAATKVVRSMMDSRSDDHYIPPSSPPQTYLPKHDHSLERAKEKTKRQQVKAEARMQQQAMAQTKAVLQDYLERTFAERSNLLANALTRLDHCIETNNFEGINALVMMILSITEQSPLAEIHKLLANNDMKPLQQPYNPMIRSINHEHD